MRFLKAFLVIAVDFLAHPFSADSGSSFRLPMDSFVNYAVPPAEPPARRKAAPMPTHKVVLWVLIALTVGSLGLYEYLAFSHPGPLTEFQKDAVKLLDWSYKGGFGAFLGILGGKAAADSEKKDKEEG